NTEIKDLDKVSSWALENVKASIAAGIITGDQNGYFNPAGATNRISAAAMLARIPTTKGVIIPDYKLPSKDANDPNPTNIGTINAGGNTFVEDIKISKAVLVDDEAAGNLFTATGNGVHGWHESRVVRTEYGTYLVFCQDERIGEKYPAAYSGYNAVVWGKFYLVKITDKGFKKVLEGEYPVHAGSCAPNVLAGEDGMIYVTTFSDDKDTYYGSVVDQGTPSAHFTAEAAFLKVYEFDTKNDTLVAEGYDVINFDLIGVHGYGYYQPIVDVANGKIYALFTGGEVPGYLSWFIYDIETHTWEKENYLVETKHRNSYFHAYPNGHGGIFFISEANPPSDAVEADYGNVFKFADTGYLFHEVNLYSIPNMYEEKVDLVNAIYAPDYLDRRKFPEIGKKDGVPIIEPASAAHYSEGTTYLASNGYLYVIYKYSDPSSTNYMYVVYDTANNFKEVTKNKKLSLMLTAANKIGTATYQFSISEAVDGDVYLTAINTKAKEATFEIYKLDVDEEGQKMNLEPMIVDSNGKAASVRMQMAGSTTYLEHSRLSYTSTRNGSIQDGILGVITYGSNPGGRSTTLDDEGFVVGQYSTVNW
ncbi:MAG: S-layer homology domain-containing protein, partial [Clostridia bacterium]|nr:S-layer homology domain-containing protein [Clostridia bacterium]